jgi:hypothetical protein
MKPGRTGQMHLRRICARFAVNYPLAGGLGGRCRGLSESKGHGRGKSELRRVVCRITSGTRASKPVDGQCHRKHTATAWGSSLELFSGRGQGEKVR